MRHLMAIALVAMFSLTIGCGEPEVAEPTTPVRPPATKKAGPPKMAAAQGGPTIGEEAPEIDGVDLDGEAFKLSDYRGKVVMLDFYGDW